MTSGNILTSLRTAFQAEGFAVDALLDPPVAMRKLFLVPPEVLLHNGEMPGRQGIEFFLKYCQCCEAPFIFDVPPATPALPGR